eukprot:5372499-Prymnesium_polylepis.5
MPEVVVWHQVAKHTLETRLPVAHRLQSPCGRSGDVDASRSQTRHTEHADTRAWRQSEVRRGRSDGSVWQEWVSSSQPGFMRRRQFRQGVFCHDPDALQRTMPPLVLHRDGGRVATTHSQSAA